MASLDEIRARIGVAKSMPEPKQPDPITYEQYKMWQLLSKSQLVETDINVLENNKRNVSNTLECPKCNSPNMHHISVETFSRNEDSSDGEHITIVENKSHGWACLNVIPPEHSVNDVLKDNPSGRRTGISVAFVCEQCHAVIKLGIAQDRGQTKLSWRHYK